MKEGKLIVFEGIDGCGKSTQIQMLAEALRQKGREVVTSAEPTDTETGKMLRRALSGAVAATPCQMAAMFTLDRIVHNTAEGGIAQTLARGADMLSDRYYYSSLAYQGSLCDYQWVKGMNVDCPDIRKPDLCSASANSASSFLRSAAAAIELSPAKAASLLLISEMLFSCFMTDSWKS